MKVSEYKCPGLEDDFANGMIANHIIEIAKTGQRDPDLLCEGVSGFFLRSSSPIPTHKGATPIQRGLFDISSARASSVGRQLEAERSGGVKVDEQFASANPTLQSHCSFQH